jgi:hypothetical protein
MLVGTHGEIPPKLSSEEKKKRAQSYFILRMKADPFLYMMYQVMWLRAEHWALLSNELSGSYHPHLVSSTCHEAADILLHKAGMKALPVLLPKRGIAISETTISFGRAFSLDHINRGIPALLYRGCPPLLLEHLEKQYGGYVPAVEEILRRVEGQD